MALALRMASLARHSRSGAGSQPSSDSEDGSLLASDLEDVAEVNTFLRRSLSAPLGAVIFEQQEQDSHGESLFWTRCRNGVGSESSTETLGSPIHGQDELDALVNFRKTLSQRELRYLPGLLPGVCSQVAEVGEEDARRPFRRAKRNNSLPVNILPTGHFVEKSLSKRPMDPLVTPQGEEDRDPKKSHRRVAFMEPDPEPEPGPSPDPELEVGGAQDAKGEDEEEQEEEYEQEDEYEQEVEHQQEQSETDTEKEKEDDEEPTFDQSLERSESEAQVGRRTSTDTVKSFTASIAEDEVFDPPDSFSMDRHPSMNDGQEWLATGDRTPKPAPDQPPSSLMPADSGRSLSSVPLTSLSSRPRSSLMSAESFDFFGVYSADSYRVAAVNPSAETHGPASTSAPPQEDHEEQSREGRDSPPRLSDVDSHDSALRLLVRLSESHEETELRLKAAPDEPTIPRSQHSPSIGTRPAGSAVNEPSPTPPPVVPSTFGNVTVRERQKQFVAQNVTLRKARSKPVLSRYAPANQASSQKPPSMFQQQRSRPWQPSPRSPPPSADQPQPPPGLDRRRVSWQDTHTPASLDGGSAPSTRTLESTPSERTTSRTTSVSSVGSTDGGEVPPSPAAPSPSSLRRQPTRTSSALSVSSVTSAGRPAMTDLDWPTVDSDSESVAPADEHDIQTPRLMSRPSVTAEQRSRRDYSSPMRSRRPPSAEYALDTDNRKGSRLQTRLFVGDPGGRADMPNEEPLPRQIPIRRFPFKDSPLAKRWQYDSPNAPVPPFFKERHEGGLWL